MIFEFENYTIDVYEEKMKTLAEKKHRCGCPPCCAFREYVHTFSDDVKKLFNELGLDMTLEKMKMEKQLTSDGGIFMEK